MSLYSVLIIDDEPWVRSLLAKLLPWEELGFRIVAEAQNGHEGLEHCWRRRIDLALTDIRMPESDGVDFMRSARVLYPQMHIVVISGHAEFGLAQEALLNGASGFLVKPVDEDALAALVLKIKTQIDAHNARMRERKEMEKTVRRLQSALSAKPGEDAPSPGGGGSELHPTIRKALELLLCDLSVRCSLGEVARELAVNPNYLSELFKREMGTGFQDFGAEMRVEKAKELLAGTDLRVKDIALGLGFQDADYFARAFKLRSGLSPLEFRAARKSDRT